MTKKGGVPFEYVAQRMRGGRQGKPPSHLRMRRKGGVFIRKKKGYDKSKTTRKDSKQGIAGRVTVMGFKKKKVLKRGLSSEGV